MNDIQMSKESDYIAFIEEQRILQLEDRYLEMAK